ncbi:MAG TPA: nucleotide exchange factor GrpE [Methylomirabilota bacterium]|nr:nucleotide exchange factor GrpE [Methylomirabilota bacterium]
MDSDAVDAPPTDLLEECRRELAEKNDRLLRALAEADNIRRRSQRDREEAVRFAAEGLVRDLIPILDNLDRALEAARAAGQSGGIVDGVELIRREFLKVLERHGVTRYSALGQRFDPNQHEAIARVVSSDKEPGTVVNETAAGYSLRGRVIRAAQVAVAGAPDEDAA